MIHSKSERSSEPIVGGADIRARRLIVTLPPLSAAEADICVADLTEVAPIRWGRAFGEFVKVEQALDDAPLDTEHGVALGVWPFDALDQDPDEQLVTFGTRWTSRTAVDGSDLLEDLFAYLSPAEARTVAARLLRAADEAEGRAL